jgi:hypothetical protein
MMLSNCYRFINWIDAPFNVDRIDEVIYWILFILFVILCLRMMNAGVQRNG